MFENVWDDVGPWPSVLFENDGSLTLFKRPTFAERIAGWVLMIWRKHCTGILSVLINNVNILYERATNDIFGFPNVAS